MKEVQLPKGWNWLPLQKLAEICSEKHQPSGSIEYYVGLEHIEKSSGKILNAAKEEPISTVKNKFKIGDIIYGKLRPNLNKVALADRDGVCSTDILVLRPTNKVEPKFLHYFMLSSQFVNTTSANTAGVNLPRVSTKFIENYPVPTPSTTIQHQIVARIEELFSEVDAGVKELQTALKQLKTYRQAVLHHYLSNEEWKRVEIGQLCRCIVPNRDKPKSFTGHIPWITIPDLNEECITIDYSAVTLGLSEQEAHESRAKIIPTGSVIMTCVGRFGIAAVVDKPLVINQQLHAFLPTDSLLPKFIAYNIIYNKQFFEQQATATTIAYINKSKCNSMPLPLISTDFQLQIVAEIESKLSEADAMETAIRESLVKAEALRQSILKQAFEGKLISGVLEDLQEPREMSETKVSVSATNTPPQQMSLF